MNFMKTFALSAGVLLGATGAHAATYAADNLNIIVDASSSSTSFNVSDTGPISSVAVTVGFSVCDTSFDNAGNCAPGGSTFNRELELWLVSAEGTRVDLVEQDTYTGQDNAASAVVTFDDDAATAVGGSLIQSGTFRPVDLLADFLGEEAFGSWSLFIGDTFGADPKRLDSYRITIDTDVSAVPLPAGAVLLLTGLGALGLRRRKKAA